MSLPSESQKAPLARGQGCLSKKARASLWLQQPFLFIFLANSNQANNFYLLAFSIKYINGLTKLITGHNLKTGRGLCKDIWIRKGVLCKYVFKDPWAA